MLILMNVNEIMPQPENSGRVVRTQQCYLRGFHTYRFQKPVDIYVIYNVLIMNILADQ